MHSLGPAPWIRSLLFPLTCYYPHHLIRSQQLVVPLPRLLSQAMLRLVIGEGNEKWKDDWMISCVSYRTTELYK